MPRSADPLRVIAPSALALALTVARPGAAEEAPRGAAPKDSPSAASTDRFSVNAQTETYVQLYRRALLPGQNGQVVPTETAVPITEYLFANARDVDAPW